MEIFSNFNHKSGLSLALGFFDGVHRGHQKVIKNAVEFAYKNNTKSAVITFINHPACYFLNLKPKNIWHQKDRIKFIEDLGVDYIYMIDFKSIADSSANEYINYLVENFSPKAITTGFNHTFGAQKSGNSSLLRDLSKKFKYEYFEIQPEKFKNEIISSTLIRSALFEGNIEKANNMLGRKFFIEGEVVHGERIGRTIGFKTANLIYPENITDLKNGVYGVNVFYNEQKYKGIMNLGIRPTVSNESKKILEVNIFDFDKNIYGKEIKIEFLKKIRDEVKFKSITYLKEQINKDVVYWRNTGC